MLTVQEIAEKTMQAMDMRERSYVLSTPGTGDGHYTKPLRDCFVEVFGDEPISQIMYIAAQVAWNDTQDWCCNPTAVERLTFKGSKDATVQG